VHVLIAIINYRTGNLVVECLRSLEPEVEAAGDVQVVVVDNASGDASPDVIDDAIKNDGWSDWATLRRLPKNGGFAYGNNLGVRTCWNQSERPDYFWLLNPDCEVRPGATATLVRFLDEHPRAGIAGSSLEFEDGEPWPMAFRFPTLWAELEDGLRFGPVSRLLEDRKVTRVMGDTPERVDSLPGASMMVRADVFESVGLMDEGYFLYYEETDFCLKVAKHGWETWYVPASRVMHICGQSTGVTVVDERPKRLPAYWFESRRRYYTKNHGPLYALGADLLFMASRTAAEVRRTLERKPSQDPPKLLSDFATRGTPASLARRALRRR
jgi:GT2 family glycosyltransferase